jgi:hypothetical protein
MFEKFFHLFVIWTASVVKWSEFLTTDREARVPFPALPEKKVVGLERGALSLVSTAEELLDRKSRGSGLENREHARRDPLRWPRGTLYPQQLAITSLTSGGRSVGVVRSRTQIMEFLFRHMWKSSVSPTVFSFMTLLVLKLLKFWALSIVLIYNTVFGTLDSVFVLSWFILSWYQSTELLLHSRLPLCRLRPNK